VHIAGAAAMLRSSSATADYGVLTQQTDAISLEMTASTILEAVDASASVAAAAAAPTATQDGNPVSSRALAVPMTKVEEAAVKEPVVETVKASQVKPDAVAPVEDPLQVVRGAGEPSEEIATKTAERTEEDRKEIEKKEKVEKEEAKEQQQSAVGRRDGPLDRAGRLAGESVGEPWQSLELCGRHPRQGRTQQTGRIRAQRRGAGLLRRNALRRFELCEPHPILRQRAPRRSRARGYPPVGTVRSAARRRIVGAASLFDRLLFSLRTGGTASAMGHA